jgi:hypothetical protein
MKSGKWKGVLKKGSGRKFYPAMAEAAMGVDVVVFHRPLSPEFLRAAQLLKQAGKKIVLDIDDTYLSLRNSLTNPKTVAKFQELLANFAKTADLVTVSTENLAKEYRAVGCKTVILPNCVNPADWPKPLRNRGKKVRIGLVGSVVYNSDFDQIGKTIERLSADPRVQLVFFTSRLKGFVGNAERSLNFFQKKIRERLKITAEWHFNVPMAQYFKELNKLRLDLMLMPRQNNYYNSCKSNLKFLESSMLEIPVIAQNPAQNAASEDDKFMKVCAGQKDWDRQIFELMANKSERLSLGKRAKKYVVKNYCISKNINLWRRAYKKLLL